MRKLVAIAAALAGCGPSVGVKFEPLAALKAPPPSKYPKGTQAVLLKQEHVADIFVGRRDRHAVVQYHEAKAILTERALKNAEVKIVVEKRAKLTKFAARTVTPDGRVVPVDASQVFRTHAVAGRASVHEDGEVHLFRFPEACVGCVLEYLWEIALDYIPTWEIRRLDDGFPVEKYAARLLYNDNLRVEAKTYNTDAPFLPKRGFESTLYQLELSSLPGNVDEPFAPPHRETEVSWVVRIRGYVGATQYHDWSEGWPAAMEHAAKDFYTRGDENPSRGSESVALDAAAVARCAKGARCLVELAVAATRDKVELDGFDDHKARRLVDVVASGHASAREKTHLLRHYLAGAGVEAWYAFSRYHHMAIDHATPAPAQLEHRLVYVPAQRGLDAPVWLDPSCEDCAVGEIPPWDAKAEALIVMGEDPRFGAFVTKTRFEPIAGTPKLDDDLVRRVDATVSASGDVEVRTELELRGTAARAAIVDDRGGSERVRRERAEKQLAKLLPTARLADFRSSCDRASARCVQVTTCSVPGYAVIDGAKLLLPLTLLFDVGVDETGRERRYDVRVNSDRAYDETITFHLPPGYTPSELPAPARASERPAAANFSVESHVDSLVVHRRFEQRAGNYPPREWPRLVDVINTHAGWRRAVVPLDRLTPPPVSR